MQLQIAELRIRDLEVEVTIEAYFKKKCAV